MKFSLLAASALAAAVPVSAEFYLKEQFDDEGWKESWTESTSWKSKSQMGTWVLSPGRFHGDPLDTGLTTEGDHRFFGISAPLDKPFVSGDKELVIQYSVKSDKKIECGGAYIKLLPGGDKFNVASFGGETEYSVMFGPDICGNNKRTHVILNHEKKQENLMIKKDIPCESDALSHLYTLVVRPDNTFEVFVDNKSVRSGDLDAEFDFLEEKEILDPSESKPFDWIDEAEIPDPESVKPEGYDDIPPEIPDPDAKKPDDWDDEDDGEWEAPMLDNPEYEGPWRPKMIPNPDYKGPWVHPKIPNPDYEYDEKMYAVCKEACTHVGFELWQVTSGVIFDDIIVTDSLEEAQKFAEETFFKKWASEKEAMETDNLKRTMERAKEAEAAKEAEEGEDDEEYEF